MGTSFKIVQDLRNSAIFTLLLTVCLVLKVMNTTPATDLLIALPFFILLYFTVFSLGTDSVINAFQLFNHRRAYYTFLFPVVLLVVYVIYLFINGQDPLKGNPLLAVYLTLVPVLAFFWRRNTSQKIGWFDFTVFAALLLPGALLNVKQNSEIPFGVDGFDSFFHIVLILTTVYAFAVVRKLNGVGFAPVFRWKSLSTAIWVWLAFYSLALLIGLPTGFIKIVGYEKSADLLIKSIFFTMIGTYLHTALFEELFFRGILQNMLAKRIGRAKTWKIFWICGLLLLLPLAFVVGYTLEGKMKWFPAMMTFMIFTAAWFLEKSRRSGMGIYTSVALTSVAFGLVHYHARSIIYIGLACVAGWAYGYTYLKTKSVFFSALVHMLVNVSALIFGLEMVK
jgi:uncharacterized protein